MVSGETSRKILRNVFIGHGFAIILPIVAGIVFGWFESAPEMGDIYLEMGDFIDEPEGGSEPQPVQEPLPQLPETPQLPQLPAVTPPTPPEPPLQESDSTLPSLPVPPRPPKPPQIPQVAPPKPATPPVTETPPPAQPSKPAASVHNDNWTPAASGSGGGSRSSSGSSRSGGGSSGFAGQLRGFIDNMWIDAPADAPPEFSSRIVQISLNIAADGRITAARVYKESGYPALDASAARLCRRLLNAKGPSPGSAQKNFIVNLSIKPE